MVKAVEEFTGYPKGEKDIPERVRYEVVKFI